MAEPFGDGTDGEDPYVSRAPGDGAAACPFFEHRRAEAPPDDPSIRPVPSGHANAPPCCRGAEHPPALAHRIRQRLLLHDAPDVQVTGEADVVDDEPTNSGTSPDGVRHLSRSTSQNDSDSALSVTVTFLRSPGCRSTCAQPASALAAVGTSRVGRGPT